MTGTHKNSSAINSALFRTDYQLPALRALIGYYHSGRGLYRLQQSRFLPVNQLCDVSLREPPVVVPTSRVLGH